MRVTTTAKHPDIDSHWRCGEVWNLSRRHERRDGGFLVAIDLADVREGSAR
jgi:hypothetical protein